MSEKKCADCKHAYRPKTVDYIVCRKKYFDIDKLTCFEERTEKEKKNERDKGRSN